MAKLSVEAPGEDPFCLLSLWVPGVPQLQLCGHILPHPSPHISGSVCTFLLLSYEHGHGIRATTCQCGPPCKNPLSKASPFIGSRWPRIIHSMCRRLSGLQTVNMGRVCPCGTWWLSPSPDSHLSACSWAPSQPHPNAEAPCLSVGQLYFLFFLKRFIYS